MRKLRAMLVTAPNCHLCAHAQAVLSRIAQSGMAIDVEELNWSDPAGSALVQRDGVPFPPALYVDGKLWGYGRLSERALLKNFAECPANREVK